VKPRTIILLLSLFITVSMLAACGLIDSTNNAPAAGDPLAPPAIYIAQPSETPVTTKWDASAASCDGKPLYAWRNPGAFTWRFSYPDFEMVSTVTQAEPVYSVPSASDCGWLSVGLGDIMKDIPTKGTHAQWDGSCQTTTAGSTKTITQQIDITIGNWEQKTTGLGTFRALRVNSVNQYSDSTTPGVMDVKDWYVCGYGRVYSESTDGRNDIKYVDELLSFTPLSTNEAHVRYIIVDSQLLNTAEPYRSKFTDEETYEALRRWDAGIRVTNLDQFARKLVNGQWQVVYAGTENPIKGMDVKLTSDPQQ
jgi:hypothetical protein